MPPSGRAIRRFFQTPKGLLILILAAETALAAPGAGWTNVGIQIAAAVALIGIVMTARRWSRQAAPAAAGNAGLDPELSARLDDELRNLD